MDFKRNREVISQALKEGCKTMAELAHYLKLMRQRQMQAA